jgi:hypothetical protein
MIQARNNLALLGSVRKGTGNPAEGIEALLRALELQNKIIVKLRSLNPGAWWCRCCCWCRCWEGERGVGRTPATAPPRQGDGCLDATRNTGGTCTISVSPPAPSLIPPPPVRASVAALADLLQEQRGEAANLCFTLAQAHLDMTPPDEEKAKIYFTEAIKVSVCAARVGTWVCMCACVCVR